MPELPEVETVARQMAPVLRGRRLRRFEILDPKLEAVKPLRRIIVGAAVRDVFRVGKQVVVAFEPKKTPNAKDAAEEAFLAIHLRMTGRLLWDAKPRRERSQWVRAILTFDGGRVAFQDLRRFGRMRIARALDDLRPEGLEPLRAEFTARRLARMLEGSPQEIKAWLMRQDRLVGLGNIYCSEILFACGVHPRRRAGGLDWEETQALQRATRRILRKAIACCGTTFSDFQQMTGENGRFWEFVKVYGREGEPCMRCGAPVVRFVQQQRSTFFCPRCQPEKR